MAVHELVIRKRPVLRIPGTMQRPTTIHLRTSLFHDASAIVHAEFAEDLSLDDIARRVASSRRQLQRAFAEIGDTTFREHLTECDVCRDEWQQLRDLPPLLAMAVRLLRPEGAQPRA